MGKELKNFNMSRLFFFPLIITIVITFLLSVLLYYYTSRNFKEVYTRTSKDYAVSYTHIVEQNHLLETHIIDDLNEKLISTARVVIENRDKLSNDYLASIADITDIHFIWWYTPDGEIIYDNTNTFIGWTPTPGDPIDNFINSGEDLLIEGIRLSTEGDVYYMVVLAKASDGSIVETALNADYVIDITDELSYQNIVNKIVSENTNIVYSYVIDIEKNIVADTRLDNNLSLNLPEDTYNSIFNGNIHSQDAYYNQGGYEVLEVFSPIIINDEVKAILVLSFTLEFYTDMNETIFIVITLIGFASIIAFGALELIQVIRPLRILDKSLSSIDVKSGVYKKPNKQMLVFRNMFSSLDKLANRIKESNDENNILNEEISMLAYTDFLTKLPNRLYLSSEIDEYIIQEIKFALLFIDLDNFKNYNDTKGHVYGDKILIAVGKILNSPNKNTRFVSRYGGDEFILLVKFNDITEIDDVIEDLYKDFHNPITVEGDEIEIDISIGVSLYPQDGTNASELIRKADIAMYESKSTGKRKHTFYLEHMSEAIKTDNDILVTIKKSLINDGFKIVLQPQINMRTGEIVSYEALARIKDSNISPVDFIRIAERSNLINSVGRLIIRKAIETLSLLRNEGLPLKTIYVNFSVHQFEDPDLINYIKDLMDQYNLSYHMFGIEITESVLIGKEEKAVEFLDEINKIGFKLALDDFGSGQAGLDYLTKYRLEVVKLDRSIALKYLNEDKLEVYITIIKLAKLLNFNVLAEGIENEEQIKLLKKTECYIVQGFFYYKPMEINDIILLNKNQNLI